MCEAKILDQEWIPYLMDDGVFQMKGIRAHIGQHDYITVLSMDAIGVNVIEVYIAEVIYNHSSFICTFYGSSN